MRKIVALLVFIVLIGASFLSGCTNKTPDNGDDDDDTTPTNQITKAEASDILMDKILKPGSSGSSSSSFLLSEMLKPGDTITSDSGETYTISSNSWFVFIDDAPWAFFSHPVRYVLIDAETGETTTIDEFWPPLINNASMWDKSSHGRGDITNNYPVLGKSVPITTGVTSGAPSADYGDAPDTQNAYYGTVGAFPTYYNTTNSRLNLHGAHCLITGEETLGLTVSAEIDADDPNDPDNEPNLVDSDKDDGVYVSLDSTNAYFSFTVKVSQNAPDVPRYINVLIDLDQNGSWMKGPGGDEWVVVNYEVNVTPGTTKTIKTPVFSWGNKTTLPTPVWMRASLTREKVNESLFSTVGGWDGSGQFDYGEIEDYIVYLRDDPPEPEDEWPPIGKDPKEPGDPPVPQPPGPTNGPCGSTVNYHSLIINGGDSSSHLGKGMSPASDAVSTMTTLLGDQSYSSSGSLGPGGNSMAAITQAFENLKSQVQCGDHILIYIIGHGKPASKGGGVTLRGTDGKTDEVMTPSDLATLLAKIPACPDEECDEPEKSCHVTVVIESCYAGNFNVPGVTGTGRTVMGSCDDEPADATGGGVFTSGFSAASNDENSDANDDDTVTPQEAFEKAEDGVGDNNANTGRAQEPWIDSQECDCVCPCSPSIDVDKWLWDSEWTDEKAVYLDATVLFKIEIENDGVCRDVSELSLVDTLPAGLSYAGDAEITYTNTADVESTVSISPSMTENVDGSLDLTWDIGSEIGLFSPEEKIEIEFSATAISIGEHINYADGSARCTYDDSIVVTDSASATVTIAEEPEDTVPPPSETLSATIQAYAPVEYGEVEGESYCNVEALKIYYNATDLTGGSYPITNVVLNLDGVEIKNHDVSEVQFRGYTEQAAYCYNDYLIEMTVTNSYGQSSYVSVTITPAPPS